MPQVAIEAVQVASRLEVMAKDAETNRMVSAKKERYQQDVVNAQTALRKIRKVVDREMALSTEELQKLRGRPQSSWSDEDRRAARHHEEVLATGRRTIQTCTQAGQTANQLNQAVRKLDTVGFRDHARRLGQHFRNLTASLNGISAAAGSGSAFDSSRAQPITLVNQSKTVDFIVNGVTVAAGATKPLAMPQSRSLTIRARAVTARRKFIQGKCDFAQKRKGGPTTVTGCGIDDPTFTATVNAGGGVQNQLSWTVTKEEYTWRPPAMLLKTRAPFDVGQTKISNTGGACKASSDVLQWNLPLIRRSQFGSGPGGAQSLLIQVRGNIEWDYSRGGTGSPAVRKSESEAFDGSLTVKLTPEG